ncbi:MAG: 8-oxo-dGDP phosphatase [Pseudonocardiales bacterium]|nr:8-oxo-dGDP phosphatase [Pseudonocardiales bacterium]
MSPTGARHTFPVRETRLIYRGRVMALRADEVEMPGGRVATREIVEHPGAVAIAAVDEQGRIAVIDQYRHAVRRRLRELPAGLLDHAGENPVDAAARELTEEAGLTATEWSVLVDLDTSPGFSDESVRVFLATGLAAVARPDLGDDEESELQVGWLPLADAVRAVLAGEIVNAVSAAGILAVQAVRSGLARPRPVDAPWPDRPTAFASGTG